MEREKSSSEGVGLLKNPPSNIPFNYNLPPSRIAERPWSPPDEALLLVIERATRKIEIRKFLDLPQFFISNDLLVFNNTKVLPARLFGELGDTLGRRDNTKIELLYLQSEELPAGETNTASVAICLAKPMRKCKPGMSIFFDECQQTEGLQGKILSRTENNELRISFFKKGIPIAISEVLHAIGVMPIPPYIRDGRGDAQDQIDYQTLFAKIEGAVAAPTASLHFTERLMKSLSAAEIATTEVTLHVGRASFKQVFDHSAASFIEPGPERMEVQPSSWEIIRATKENGGKVIAVGTTVVRTLETSISNSSKETNLFIRPPFNFQVISGMITNFHFPGSSHLLLVEAFLGRELLEKAYNVALNNNFRFLSYGDGMLIL